MKIEKIFAIPHFHYDVEWWKVDYLYALDAEDILNKALELLEKYPEFTYVIDQALSLRPYWQKYPERREKILNYIKKGKIELVGGTFAAPDENIPYGESFVRQFIYGKKFFVDVLNSELKVGWEIDEFGHPSQIPQILLKSGFPYFVFARGVIPWDSLHPLDFYWQAPDGSKILTHWFAAHYCGMIKIFPSKQRNIKRFYKEVRARISYEGKRASTSKLLFPFGTDFSIPAEEWMEFVKEWNEKKQPFEPKIEFSTPSEFFKEIEKEKKLLIEETEFNPILTGCYESREKIKKYARLSQNKIIEAEKINSIAYCLGKEYPTYEFDFSWEKILENDFHDIICGTGTDKVYKSALKRYKESLDVIEKITEEGLNYIAKKINTESNIKGKPIIVFNSLSWEREELVRLKLEKKDFNIYDFQGNLVPSQKSEDGILFLAKVPSLGYKLFYLVEEERKEEVNKFSNSENNLENKFYKIEIDEKSGNLRSIFDKEKNIEILDVNKFLGNEIILEEEVGNLWTVQKTGKILREKPPYNIKLIENGHLRSVLLVKAKYHKMDVVKKIILYSNLKRIDFEVFINFKGKNKRVKIVFAINFKGEKFFETPFYVNKREDGHWCAQNFVDYSSEDYGFSLLNTGNPGYEVQNNVLSLILFRSVSIYTLSFWKFFFKHFFDIIRKIYQAAKLQISGLNILEFPLYPYHGLMLREWASSGGPTLKGGWTISDHIVPYLRFWEKSDAWEQGEHYFKYAILPHNGDFREENLPKRGYELNNPLIVVLTDKHSGELPSEFSFLNIHSENLILSALKKEEKGNNLIARFYETFGEYTELKFNFFKKIKSLKKISLTEDEIYEEILSDDIKIKNWEICTISFKI